MVSRRGLLTSADLLEHKAHTLKEQQYTSLPIDRSAPEVSRPGVRRLRSKCPG